MTNQEILDKIATLEKGISNPSVPESAKATLKTKIEALKAQIEKVEEKLEQKEEKLEQKEEKIQNELEEKISKLERGINNPNVPESAKAALRKKLADAKEELSSQKKEIAEDKKEAKQEMKEVKEAVKDLEKAAKSQRKTPIKKPVIKEKERAVKSEKRTAKLKSLLTGLDAIVEKNKALKEKYKGKGVDLKKDAGRPAKPFGYRFVGKHDYRKPSEAQIKAGLKRGTIDYEARPNRSDKYPKGYKGSIKLADGGETGGYVKAYYNDSISNKDNGYQVNLMFFTNKSDEDYYDEEFITTKSPKEAQDLAKKINEKGYEGFMPKGMMAKGGETGQMSTAKSYWNKFDKQKRIDFLIGAGYSKSVANDLSSESWDSLEKGVHSDLRAVLMADGGMMAKGGGVKSSEKYVVEKDKDGTYRILNTEKNMYVDHTFETKASADSWKESRDYLRKTFGREYADGGMMAKGGKPKDLPVVRTQFEEEEFEYAKGGKTKERYKIIQDVSDMEDPSGAWLVVDTQTDRILAEFDFKKEAQSFLYDYTMRKDEMARGGVSKGVKHYSVDIDLENGDNVRDLEYKSLDKAKAVYEKYKKEMIYKGDKIDDIQLIKVLTNGDYESVGNQMARGGKTKKAEPKHSKAKDAQRFAKPKGYRWKNEAVTDGIIKKAALSKVPSLYQRKKYPDYVYYEDRTSKSDKSPSRKYKSL